MVIANEVITARGTPLFVIKSALSICVGQQRTTFQTRTVDLEKDRNRLSLTQREIVEQAVS